MKLKLVDSAVASDGGSIGLTFISEDDKEYYVSLDQGIGSPTKNKLFSSDYSNKPLTLEQERQLLPILEKADISDSEDGCKGLLLKITKIIKEKPPKKHDS